MQLRPYQQEAVERVFEEWKTAKSTLIVLPTGCGKTLCMAEIARRVYVEKNQRVILLAHREELIFQAQDKIHKISGLDVQVEMGAYRTQPGLFDAPPVIVSTIQTQTAGNDGGGRMTKFDPSQFGLLLVDECFIAGTLVDGVPIEKIKLGRTVETHQGRGMVTHVFKTPAKELCRITTRKGREIVCTPNHPIWNGQTWVPASLLTKHSILVTIIPSKGITDEKTNVFSMFKRVFTKIMEQLNGSILFKGMQASSLCQTEKSCALQLFDMWKGIGIVWKKITKQEIKKCSLWIARMQINSFTKRNPKNIRCSWWKHDISSQDKRNEQAGSQSGRVNKAPCNGMEANGAGRKWTWANYSRAGISKCIRMGLECVLGYKNASYFWLSNVLQIGHWKSCFTNWNRGRWVLPPGDFSTRAGHQENRVFENDWVESVEVYKQGSGDEFARLCPDGFVYNLEVTNGNTYFANGILVHNCHHATAGSYRRCIEWYSQNPNLKILGVTATPDRSDEEALGQVFESVAYDYEVMDAIQDGWLVPVKQQMVSVGHMDLSNVHTTAGDLNQGELSEVLENEQTLHEIAHPTSEICGDRRAIVFAATVKQAERLCEIFNRIKPNSSAWVCGKTDKEVRKKLLADFKAGIIQYVCNVGVLTEGFDDDGVEVIVMARPTKSRSLYAQMAGRGTRPHSTVAHELGKMGLPEDRRNAIKDSPKGSCLIIDFVGNSGKHKLCSSADILGGKYTEEEVQRATDRAKASNEAVDMTDELEKARKAIQDEKLRQAARRAAIVCRTKYSVTEINPFDVFDIVPSVARGWDRCKVLSAKQKEMLEKQGIKTENLSYTHGKQLLDEIFRRWNKKMPSLKQQKVLNKAGFTAPMRPAETKKVMEQLAQRWK